MIRPTKSIRGKVHSAKIDIYPELENIEITPTVDDQTYKSNMYGFDEVKVKGVQAYIDEDIKPEYIVEGVDILGVVGNYKGIDTSDATVTTDDVLSGKIVYINNEKQIGTMPDNGELEYEPSDEEQTIPTGYTSGGSVLPADITKLDEYDKCLTIINSIEDMSEYSDTTATAEDIKEGKTAYSNGERIVGTYQEKISTNIEGYAQNNTQFSIKNVIETIDLSKEDLSSFSSFLNAFSWSPSLKKVIMPENTSYITSVQQMFMGCTSLEEFNYFDISNVTTKDGTLNMLSDGTEKLTDETLNTVLLMLSETNVPLEYRSFRRVAGYTYPLSRLQALPNYQKFVDAGWSYEYK